MKRPSFGTIFLCLFLLSVGITTFDTGIAIAPGLIALFAVAAAVCLFLGV